MSFYLFYLFFIGDSDSIALEDIGYQVLSCVREVKRMNFKLQRITGRRIQLGSLFWREQVSMTKPKDSCPSLLDVMFRANVPLLHQDGS